MPEELAEAPDNSLEDTEQSDYKKLQTRLNRSNERNKELLRGFLEVGETNRAVARLENALTKILESSEDGSGTLEALKKQRDLDTSLVAHRQKVAELLDEHDMGWDDERLVTAREKWKSGDLPGALTEIQKVAGADPSSIEAEVERRLAERLRQGAKTVDKGEAVGTGKGKRLTRGDSEKLWEPGMSLDKARENTDQFLDQFFAKKR